VGVFLRLLETTTSFDFLIYYISALASEVYPFVVVSIFLFAQTMTFTHFTMKV